MRTERPLASLKWNPLASLNLGAHHPVHPGAGWGGVLLLPSRGPRTGASLLVLLTAIVVVLVDIHLPRRTLGLIDGRRVGCGRVLHPLPLLGWRRRRAASCGRRRGSALVNDILHR